MTAWRSASSRVRGWVVTLFAAVVCFASIVQGSDPGDISLKRGSSDFLFFRGDYYYPSVDIPRDETFDPDAEQTALLGFSATFKLGESGTLDIPALHFECQGVRYVLPTHRIIVLDALPKDEGLSVVSRTDPNGSGCLEVMFTFHSTADGKNYHVSFDRSKCPETLEIVSEWGDTRYKGQDKWQYSKIVFRNKADVAFVLKPEHIKGLSEIKNWPVIEIKPTIPVVAVHD